MKSLCNLGTKASSFSDRELFAFDGMGHKINTGPLHVVDIIQNSSKFTLHSTFSPLLVYGETFDNPCKQRSGIEFPT